MSDEHQLAAVGEDVHYVSHGTPIRDDGTQAYTQQCRAAKITEIGGGWTTEDVQDLVVEDGVRRRLVTQRWDGTLVGLEVSNPTGTFFHPLALGGVPHDEGGNWAAWSCTGRNYPGGTWHYPA
jgi:hypothetical protein